MPSSIMQRGEKCLIFKHMHDDEDFMHAKLCS
jgi:hypothetical protein